MDDSNGTSGRLLYKVVPDDIRIPAFLVPYEVKNMGFSKVFVNFICKHLHIAPGMENIQLVV